LQFKTDKSIIITMEWQSTGTGSIDENKPDTVQQVLSPHGTSPVPEAFSLPLAQQERENSATRPNEVKSRPCL
jgi:hypothetical protein